MTGKISTTGFDLLVRIAKIDTAVLTIEYNEPENCFEINYRLLFENKDIFIKRCYDINYFIQCLIDWEPSEAKNYLIKDNHGNYFWRFKK